MGTVKGTQWGWGLPPALPSPPYLSLFTLFPSSPLPPPSSPHFHFPFPAGTANLALPFSSPHTLLTHCTQGHFFAGGVGQSSFPSSPFPPPFSSPPSFCRSRCRQGWDGLPQRGDPAHQQHEGRHPAFPQVTPSWGAGDGFWWRGTSALREEWSCCVVVGISPMNPVSSIIKTSIKNTGLARIEGQARRGWLW